MADANAYNALLGDYGDPSYWRTPMRQPNALYDGGPVWENNHAAPVQQRQRPADWSVTSGIAEAISPTMGAYGMGNALGTTYQAAKAGDYGNALESALPLAAIFAGPGAKTSNKVNLMRAQEMHAKGLPREAIHKDTGWFQGVDGKWRFEIDDSGLRTSLGSDEKAIRHPELEAAYPNNFYDIVGDVRRALMPSGSYINGGGGPNVHGRKIVEAYGPTESSRNTSAAHELQHFAQDMERFAPGASADAFANHVAIPGTDFSVISNPLEARKAYRSTAGEVEARAVEARINLTPEQRAARPPWLDYDVPENQQIVRMGGSGPQMSQSVNPLMQAAIQAEQPKGIRAYHGSPHDFEKFDINSLYGTLDQNAKIR